MQSDHITTALNRRHLQRISLWITVVLYTAALPYVILVFRAIDRHFSPQIAGKTPLFIIIILAVVYTGICMKKKAAARCVIILSAGALVVLFIMKFEPNANKYIHIPEYVLMTWILYSALAVDYKGSGILLLVFVCAAMLGVVDELLQGIHPQRTYGWKDMIIDTASSFIGVLTLLGVKHQKPGNWTWLGHLKRFKSFTAAILFGALTALPMCIYLFDVQAQGRFWKVYPRWLLAGNGLFLTAAAAVVIFFWCCRPTSSKVKSESNPEALDNHTTALLWVMCPLTILISMHALVVWVAVAGITFR